MLVPTVDWFFEVSRKECCAQSNCCGLSTLAPTVLFVQFPGSNAGIQPVSRPYLVFVHCHLGERPKRPWKARRCLEWLGPSTTHTSPLMLPKQAQAGSFEERGLGCFTRLEEDSILAGDAGDADG